ncbi:ABC transmembrane type-1 domain-containing protein [Caenorhabditis elegans]|uniref:ABC transmembrane type-1 domain-containing protein n=1 Tax=Caenorhabditis elegans TaxID=6239 RepID=O16246_CAEEL|nr:ABC transmembrane type-1 domain-containing protein [Caenorhabditis elegans]CCD64387.1 ABC transmembrane type-1 domain-containing protein [Caenorhabditis elegans]|eukprot:NP_504346.1 Serpentine Receptor, class R [Caenorhabditis elegans]
MITPSPEVVGDEVSCPSIIEIPSTKEPLSENALLGPFRKIIKITGLDCSLIARAEFNPSLRIKSILTRIVALVVVAIVFFRMAIYSKAEGACLSLAWAEGNMFQFMALQTIVCALCLFGWTKNSFISKHLGRLEKVRSLRIKENIEMDNYSNTHRKAFIWSGFYIAAIMSHAIMSSIAQKILIANKTVIAPLYIAMVFINLLSCFIVAICLIYYFLVNLSLSREIRYFNTELEDAKQGRRLQISGVLSDFCHRQAELIRVVRETNESLQSYATVAPLFAFNSLINAVFIASGFSSSLPPVVFGVLLFDLFAVIGLTFFTLRPASNVQYDLAQTARILMDSEEFEGSQDVEVFKAYQVMINRSLKHTAHIRVVGAIPIYPTSAHFAFLLIPNLGNILAIVRKVLVEQGIQI